MFLKGIFRIKDLYDEKNEIHWETVHAVGVEPHHYLYWASITSAVPHNWKILMKDADFNLFVFTCIDTGTLFLLGTRQLWK